MGEREARIAVTGCDEFSVQRVLHISVRTEILVMAQIRIVIALNWISHSIASETEEGKTSVEARERRSSDGTQNHRIGGY